MDLKYFYINTDYIYKQGIIFVAAFLVPIHCKDHWRTTTAYETM